VGHDGTEAWLQAVGTACNVAQAQIDAAKNQWLPAIAGALAKMPVQGRITLSRLRRLGAAGGRLLVKRRRPALRGHRLPAHALERRRPAVAGSARRARAVPRVAGAGPGRRAEFKPDLAVGTTPVVQAAKQASIPALYFTNLISARPLMGPAGAGSLAQVVNAAIANKARFDTMSEFFGDTGKGDKRRGVGRHAADAPRVPRRDAPPAGEAGETRKAEEMI
jgi:chlorophyllide a reductase subunit Y